MITSDRPTCSVCIANYNGMGLIDSCLKSVLAQDCNFQVEVIVHDDASTDDSAKFIRKNFSGVILMVSNENVGFCVSNRRMAAKARGEYILFLNNDATLFPDALQTLYGQAVRERKPAILGLPQYDAATGKLIDLGSLFDFFLNPLPNLNSERKEVGMVIGACLWLPKILWDEIGGFPEWFQSLAEDMYLCCLARLNGNPVKVISHSGFKHWVGKSLGGGKLVHNRLATSLKRRTLSERNKSFVMVLCYPTPFFQLLFPIHISLLLAEGIILSAIKFDWGLLNSIYLACLKSLWKERARLLHLRGGIQKSPRVKARQFFSPFIFRPHKLGMLLRHGVPDIR